VHLEQTLSEAYRAQGDAAQAAAYQARALTRSEAIQRLMWDPQDGLFSDYLWEAGEFTGAVTAATLYPLFLRIATERQARVVAATVERRLLDVGGLATTLAAAPGHWAHPTAARSLSAHWSLSKTTASSRTSGKGVGHVLPICRQWPIASWWPISKGQ
jgi:neutral trehalase